MKKNHIFIISFLLISCGKKVISPIITQELISKEPGKKIFDEPIIEIQKDEGTIPESFVIVEDFTQEKEEYLISQFKNTRYFKNDKIVHNMFVNAGDGLRIRKSPYLNGEKLGTIPFMQAVKIISIGRKITIDEIDDNWIEILLPRYLWKGQEPEYGWVFGGYLSFEKPDFFLETESVSEIEAFLRAKIWKSEEEQNRWVVCFEKDGRYKSGLLYSGTGELGRYKIIDKNVIDIETEILDEFNPKKFSEKRQFKIISDNEIEYNGQYLFAWLFPTIIEDCSFYEQLYSDYYDISLYDYLFSTKLFGKKYEEDHNYSEKQLIIYFLIQSGVSASGTEYETQFHDYWKKIMYEHQIKNEKN